MENVSIKIKDYNCFSDEPMGFDQIKPINIIIGKNNAGKSTLLTMLEKATLEEPQSVQGRDGNQPRLVISAPVSKDILNQVVLQGVRFDDMIKADECKEQLIGSSIKWEQDFGSGSDRKPIGIEINPAQEPITNPFLNQYLDKLNTITPYPFKEVKVKRLSAERNIVPDKVNRGYIGIAENGENLTNAIRDLLQDKDSKSEIIEYDFLNEINTITNPEINFTKITVKNDKKNDTWEIYLSEEQKTNIPLSQMGSGIKTVILIVYLCHTIPKIEGHKTPILFCIEEPENNLHPAMLRRLLNYIDQKAKTEHSLFFITTHSNAAIDTFAQNENAQIVHVKHENGKSTVETVDTYLGHKSILDDLDVRASDLLQSNCLVWVEGPSDRIYFNRWIEILSQGQIREGAHYQCVFYGGKLLAHIEAKVPDAETHLINILKVNQNAILLMDSDIKPTQKNITDTKTRIMKELSEIGGFPWITSGREVENYIPAGAIQKKYEIEKEVTQVLKSQEFWAYLDEKQKGEGEKFRGKKVQFAQEIIEHITLDDLEKCFDLKDKATEALNFIKKCNRLA